MLKVEIQIVGSSLSFFGEDKQRRGGGWNFRIKHQEGQLLLKPSSRTNQVEGELFGSLDPKSGRGIFDAPNNFSMGSYSLNSGKHGWKNLQVHSEGNIKFTLLGGIPDPSPKEEKIKTEVKILGNEIIQAPTNQAQEFINADDFLGNEKKIGNDGFRLVSGENARAILKISWLELRRRIRDGEYRISGNKILIPV